MATATRQSASDARCALRPVLPQQYALRLRHVVACGLFAALFLYVDHLPLWHTDLWGHVGYGKWILAHGALPTEDPFMPLAEGMRAVEYAWLSQVVLAQIESAGGPEWLCNVFAGVVLLTYVVLARAIYLRSGWLSLSLLGVLLALAVGWSRLSTLRPETFGALCFALLLWFVVGETARRRDGETARQGDGEASREYTGKVPSGVLSWLGLPVLFALWANLHGSFLCGLAVMACCTGGRLIEVAWATRSVGAVLRDLALRRWLLLTELAAAATLLNPYGMDLPLYCVQFRGNENLRDVMEWVPLVLRSATGVTFALSCVLLGIALRFSRRRFRAEELLLCGVFAAAAVSSIRMIGWYAGVMVVVLSGHFGDILQRLMDRGGATSAAENRQAVVRSGRTSFRYSLVCALIVWMSFAFSGWSRPVLGRSPRPRDALYSRETPTGISAFLRAHPPSGQIFNPQWWGDWLVWDGPAELKPFATTNVHLIPRQVWNDYLRIAHARPGWQAALDRYRVTSVVVDKKRQPLLLSVMRRHSGWTIRYEDELGLVLERSDSKQGAGQERGIEGPVGDEGEQFE